MNTPNWFSNVTYWSAQVALLVLAAGFLPYIFKIRQPRVLLIYWRALIVVTILLPFAQPWHRPEPVAAINFAPRIGEFTPIVTATSAPSAHLHLPSPQMIAEIIGLIILAGITARFTILALGLMKLRQFRRASSPISNHAESSALLNDMRVRVNTGGEFRLSTHVASPVTFGFTAPVILLPERFPTLDAQYQSAIACHELLHVRRRDWAHHLSEEILRAALWFHPAIAWLISRIRLSREQVVDLEVVKLTDARKPYLEALLEFTNSRALATAIPAPPFLVERQLAERVALMLKEVRMSRTRLIASLTAIVACLAVVATLAVWTFPLKAAPRPQQNPPIDGIVQGVTSGVVGGVTNGAVKGVLGGVIGGVTKGVSGGIADGASTQGVKDGVSNGAKTTGPVTLTDSYVGPVPIFGLGTSKVPLDAASQPQPAPKIIVTDIKFEGEVHDADAVRARVIKYSQLKNWDATDPDWLDELAEVGVRGDLQDHGYFEVTVDGVKSQVLESTPTRQRVVASFHVKEGDQFRAGEFTFVGVDPARGPVIPVSNLREQFHLQTGDILNVDELRHGIERITQLYGTHGYLDFTARPAFTIDHQGRTVAMALTLTEGIQYHVASFVVHGLDASSAARLEIKIQPGTLYDNSLVHELFERGKAASHSSVSWVDGIHVTRNVEARTVDVVLDFTPKFPSPAPPTVPPAPKLQSSPANTNSQAADTDTKQAPNPTFTTRTSPDDPRSIRKFQYLPPAGASSSKFQSIPPAKPSSGTFETVAPFAPATSLKSPSPVKMIDPLNVRPQNSSGPVYRAGQNGVTSPTCQYCPRPEYPQEARDANIQGTVYLQVTVLTNGRAGAVKVTKSLEKSLDEQAIKIVIEQWTFKPATDQNGDPVNVTIPIEIVFQLYGPPQQTPPSSGNSAAAKPVTPLVSSNESLQTKIFTGPVTDNAASAPFYMGLVNTQILYAPQPELPRLARQAKVQGTVTLNVIVNTEGRVIVAEYVKGPAILAQSAISTVRDWIIKGTHDGAPVTFQMSVEVGFNGEK